MGWSVKKIEEISEIYKHVSVHMYDQLKSDEDNRAGDGSSFTAATNVTLRKYRLLFIDR